MSMKSFASRMALRTQVKLSEEKAERIKQVIRGEKFEVATFTFIRFWVASYRYLSGFGWYLASYMPC